MADKHAVVRTDLMSATDDRSRMRSFRFGKTSGTEFVYDDIDNGYLVVLGDLIEHDLWKAELPKANTSLNELVLVTTPEKFYDERQKFFYEFYNQAGTNATGMKLKIGDIYSVTAEALDYTGTPKVGWIAEVTATGKTKLVATATASTTKIGTLTEIETQKSGDLYVIQVTG